ncbi:MAG TPA: hypothetical protein VL463_22105, partial [Kofleriaceae bacterium]|nr:hypothetical protein [Kofleriaceae bacterium]
GFLAIPAAADQDLIAIGPGFTRTILGSAGFPAAGVDMLGNLYGLDGAALTRLDRSTGVHTLFEVPGTIAKPKPPVASEAATGACPGPTAIRKATLHNQLWLLPLAVIANDKLTDASGAIESHSDEILSTIDASRARAAGAPALPHDVWILGTGDTPACHGVVRGYYGATDDVSQDSIVGAIIAGCGADLSGITVVDAAPGACKVAQLESVETADLPPDLASEADFAVPLGDPRLAPSAYYVAYRVRIPDDGRGYAHLAVDDRADPLMEGDPEPYSSGWRWIPADGKTVERREVADDLSEAITALVYDASGPRFAIIDGDCRYTIAQIGDDGALTRRATRKLERRTCNREGNPPAAWLSPHEGDLLQTM